MNIHHIIKDKSFLLFLALFALFLANALVAEFVGLKIFSLEKLLGQSPLNMNIFGVEGLGFNLTAGVVLWPVVFIMTDIINEYFGAKIVKIISYTTAFVIATAFIFVWITIKLPPNDWWQFESGRAVLQNESIHDMNIAFKKVMGSGLWIIIGSMVAFLLGQILDVFTFQKIKQATGEKKLWLRATGSTIISQFIDSFVVLFIAFYIGADWDLVRVLAIGIVNYMYKFGIAVLLTPVLYLVHFIIENYLGNNLATEMKNRAAGTL